MGNRAKARRGRAEDPVNRQRVSIEGVEAFLRKAAAVQPDRDQVAFLCIGTDCSTGDSFGPLVGTLLKQSGWGRVVGTLDDPCDADRYESLKSAIPESLLTIAIDACLGSKEEEPGYIVGEGPLFPGHAVGKRLSPAGHYSIAGIVGPKSVKPYWTIQHASLHEVLGMARALASAVQAAWSQPEVEAMRLKA
ncbi:spore protease YyaC [Paenibacillus rhizovicinus]|uniref:Spore protease YyaC n=1 Tax=Paenibacillus rhizovicinus TaxID=2704463 RepID=A0A6C0P2B6_9BACL|nr:spore protease YyaC [Paenibacillus rhizovicinus]QHW30822.1 spore protease YyaC [Paenibacillus rhizovicinus]